MKNDAFERLPIEGHTVKTFRCEVFEERHSFAIECITKGNKRLLIEFPSEGAIYLERALRTAFGEHPQMREWKSPTAH